MHGRIPASAVLAVALLGLAQAAQGQRPLPDDPNKVRAREHYDAAWEHMRSEAFERAAAEFQLATDFDPALAMAWYGLGRAHMALGLYRQALLNLKECRALFLAQLSRRFSSRMDADKARRDQLLELEHLRGQYLKGPQTMQSRDMLRLIENQIRSTNQALEREFSMEFEDPVPAFVSLSLGSAYFRTEQFEEAERAYGEAVRADDRLGAAHNNLAVIYLMQGRRQDAERHIRSAEESGFIVNPDLKAQIQGMAQR